MRMLRSNNQRGSLLVPSLNLDFMTGVMPPGLTFLRGSIGTYIDSAGLMQAASANVPRFDYDPLTKTLKGLLIEESRTNSIARSNDWNFGYNPQSSTSSANATLAPNGLTDGAIVTSPSGSIGYNFLQNGGASTSGTVISGSFFVKLISSTAIVLSVYVGDATSSAGGASNFNFTSAGVPTYSTSGIPGIVENFGNGWYRIKQTFTASAAINNLRHTFSVQNNGTSNQIAFFGAQFELGSFATSYIPTTTAAVTRSADACSLPTGPWYNPAQGTLFVEAQVYDNASSSRGLASLSDGSSANRYTLYRQAGSRFVRTYVNPGSAAAGTTVVNENTIFKAAFGYQVGVGLGISVNGSAVETTTYSTPPGINTLNIGSSFNGGEFTCGWIRKVRYYPNRLPDSSLKLLTV